jgi:hypothetical protein
MLATVDSPYLSRKFEFGRDFNRYDYHGNVDAKSALFQAIRILEYRCCQTCQDAVSPSVFPLIPELTMAIHDLQNSQKLVYQGIYSQLCWEQILAANLLGWNLYSTYVKEASASACFKLAFATLSFQLNSGLEFEGHDMYSHSTRDDSPFILDCANAWVVRNGEITPRWTTFSQRVRYFDRFRVYKAPEWDIWNSSELEAANSTIGNVMEVGVHWLHRFAKQEAEFNFSREKVDQVLQYIRSELGDTDLQGALSALYRSSQGPNTNHATLQGQLITRLFHRMRCVLFIHQALSADSIYLGVRDRDALTIAQKVTYHCLRQVIRREGPIEDYFRMSWHNFSYLMLGGIGLTDDCPQRSMPPGVSFGLTFQVRDWVIDELMFIGREECATALRSYWANGTIQELVQILAFAQFPREMPEDAPQI